MGLCWIFSSSPYMWYSKARWLRESPMGCTKVRSYRVNTDVSPLVEGNHHLWCRVITMIWLTSNKQFKISTIEATGCQDVRIMMHCDKVKKNRMTNNPYKYLFFVKRIKNIFIFGILPERDPKHPMHNIWLSSIMEILLTTKVQQ